MLRFLERIRNFITRVRVLRETKRRVARRALRLAKVEESLTHEGSLLGGRPFIAGGVHHWKYVERPFTIDFFFHDVPLAVLVADECYGPYRSESVVDRKFWQARNESDLYVVDVCRRADIPVLVIGPDDPIGLHALNVAVGEALAGVN